MPMNVANKYFNSAWRRDDAHCPGGFMMESSVHFLAALRMLAAAGGAQGLYTGIKRMRLTRGCAMPRIQPRNLLVICCTLDGGVAGERKRLHVDAVLQSGRLSGTGAGEARQAWAHSSHANAELPSPDTLVGGLVFDADVAASVSISFAAAQVRFSLSVVGTDGSLEVAAKLFPVSPASHCSDVVRADH